MISLALDHVVINVSDLNRARDFYARVLDAEIVAFGAGRKAVQIGNQKLNLHDAAARAAPVARHPSVGGADLCVLTETPITDVVRHLQGLAVDIIDGPVERTGAMGPILSVYFHDPDGNLIEISNPLAP
jgi:catechol 2,3-dioxygenase-like lactoylglutathione lyase family enzyme